MRTSGLAWGSCNVRPEMLELMASWKHIVQPLLRIPLPAISRPEVHVCLPFSQAKPPRQMIPGRTDLQGRSSLREDPAEWRTTAGRAREGFGFGSTGREKGSAAPGWIAARTKTGNLAGEDRAELDRETTGEGRQPSRWRYRCCIAAFFLLHVAC